MHTKGWTFTTNDKQTLRGRGISNNTIIWTIKWSLACARDEMIARIIRLRTNRTPNDTTAPVLQFSKHMMLLAWHIFKHFAVRQFKFHCLNEFIYLFFECSYKIKFNVAMIWLKLLPNSNKKYILPMFDNLKFAVFTSLYHTLSIGMPSTSLSMNWHPLSPILAKLVTIVPIVPL